MYKHVNILYVYPYIKNIKKHIEKINKIIR